MADSYWFKINPEKYLSIAGRIPDGTQRAEFLAICLHCLAMQGALPDDDEEIAFITAIGLERIKALRPYLNRLCRREDGELIPTVAEEAIIERREYSEKQASSGRKGGKQAKAIQSNPQGSLNDTSVNESNPQGSLNDTQAKQTDRQTDKTDRQTAAARAIPKSLSGKLQAVAAAEKTTEEIEALTCQLISFYGVNGSSGWQLQGKYQSAAIELHGQQATTEQITAFWRYRKKKPAIQYFVTDFLSWRASADADRKNTSAYVGAPSVKSSTTNNPLERKLSPDRAKKTRWGQVLELLDEKIGREQVATWFDPLTINFEDAETLFLCAPDAIFQDWIQCNYATEFAEALKEVAYGETVRFVFAKGENDVDFSAG